MTAQVDDMMQVVDDAWADAGVILWPNTSADPPTARAPWARVNLQHTSGEQRSLAGSDGRARWTRGGFMTVQMFFPAGEGLSRGHSIAMILQDALDGRRTPNGVVFQRARLNEVGLDGLWFQINVLVDFQYEEVK